MLESRRLTVTARSVGLTLDRRFVVADAATGAPLGTAEDESDALVARVFPFSRLQLASVVVREGPDGSCLFTLVRFPHLRRPHFAVYDAQSELVGRLVPAGLGARLTVTGPAGKRLMVVRSGRTGRRVRVAGPAGRLAVMTRTRVGRVLPATVTSVVLSRRLDGKPFLTMLVVAAALALDGVGPPPPRRDGGRAGR